MSLSSNSSAWTASSYSISGGQCVEWAPEAAAFTGSVPVRDSKEPGGPILTFPTTGWRAFVATLHVPAR